MMIEHMVNSYVVMQDLIHRQDHPPPMRLPQVLLVTNITFSERLSECQCGFPESDHLNDSKKDYRMYKQSGLSHDRSQERITQMFHNMLAAMTVMHLAACGGPAVVPELRKLSSMTSSTASSKSNTTTILSTAIHSIMERLDSTQDKPHRNLGAA